MRLCAGGADVATLLNRLAAILILVPCRLSSVVSKVAKATSRMYFHLVVERVEKDVLRIKSIGRCCIGSLVAAFVCLKYVWTCRSPACARVGRPASAAGSWGPGSAGSWKDRIKIGRRVFENWQW